MPYIEPGFDHISIDPNAIIDNDDRQCVADCDTNDVNNDEDWWNACIDQCLDKSRNQSLWRWPLARHPQEDGE